MKVCFNAGIETFSKEIKKAQKMLEITKDQNEREYIKQRIHGLKSDLEHLYELEKKTNERI